MIPTIIQLIKRHKNEVILAVVIFLISLLSFATGYITAKHLDKENIQFFNNQGV
jgi:multisubunit Na+/H+ antiporter MnhF subunit